MKYEIRSAGEPDEEDKGFEEKGNTEKQSPCNVSNSMCLGNLLGLS